MKATGFRIFILIILGLSLSFSAFADKVSSPPPLQGKYEDSRSAIQHYLTELSSNIHSPDITVTAPNGSRRGRNGTLVIYNNGGTYELWVKDNVDSTSWQKIGP